MGIFNTSSWKSYEVCLYAGFIVFFLLELAILYALQQNISHMYVILAVFFIWLVVGALNEPWSIVALIVLLVVHNSYFFYHLGTKTHKHSTTTYSDIYGKRKSSSKKKNGWPFLWGNKKSKSAKKVNVYDYYRNRYKY